MQTIEDWPSQLGLSKYMEAFVQNDVDLRALSHITEADLRELGVSLGHRKIILAAINERRGDTSSDQLLAETASRPLRYANSIASSITARAKYLYKSYSRIGNMTSL